MVRSLHSHSMDKVPWSEIHAQVHRGLKVRSLLPPDTSLLVAVSGGQDSIALLKLLVDLQPKWHWRLQGVHCDHRWRTDSGENAAFVQDLCHQWQVPCQVITAENSPKTEAEARHWRYAALGSLARENECNAIVTGHTASDRAETLLYNLLRGSGTEGLQALAWQRPLSPEHHSILVVRPLLNLTRQDTAQFCQRFTLPLWPDATNDDIGYARNRLRLEVFPYLAEYFNPQVDRTLAQTAEILTAEANLLGQMAQTLYQATVEFSSTSQTWHLQRSTLQAAPLALQRRVIHQLLQQVITTQVSFDQVEKLVALITAPNRTQTDPLPGGWRARVAQDWIILDSLKPG
jgi:tRNA(Ile)-lysidine synthase